MGMTGTGGERRWARGDLPPQLTSGDPQELWQEATTRPVSGLVVRLEVTQARRSRRGAYIAFLYILLILVLAAAIAVYLFQVRG